MNTAARGRVTAATVFLSLSLPAGEVASCGPSFWTELRRGHSEVPGSETLHSDWIENYRRKK